MEKEQWMTSLGPPLLHRLPFGLFCCVPMHHCTSGCTSPYTANPSNSLTSLPLPSTASEPLPLPDPYRPPEPSHT